MVGALAFVTVMVTASVAVPPRGIGGREGDRVRPSSSARGRPRDRGSAFEALLNTRPLGQRATPVTVGWPIACRRHVCTSPRSRWRSSPCSHWWTGRRLVIGESECLRRRPGATRRRDGDRIATRRTRRPACPRMVAVPVAVVLERNGTRQCSGLVSAVWASRSWSRSCLNADPTIDVPPSSRSVIDGATLWVSVQRAPPANFPSLVQRWRRRSVPKADPFHPWSPWAR